MSLHAHYKRVPHPLCNGTGWLTTVGSKTQIRCKCENGFVLEKQDDLIDVLKRQENLSVDLAISEFRDLKKRTINANDSPIKPLEDHPHGWKIGEPPTPEDQ